MEESRSSGTNAKRRTGFVQKHVWFSDADWDVVTRRMRVYEQKNFSKFAREVLTTGLVSVSYRRSKRNEIASQIARIGNNINQIARQANMNNFATLHMVVEALDLLKEVHSIVAGMESNNGNSPSNTN